MRRNTPCCGCSMSACARARPLITPRVHKAPRGKCKTARAHTLSTNVRTWTRTGMSGRGAMASALSHSSPSAPVRADIRTDTDVCMAIAYRRASVSTVGGRLRFGQPLTSVRKCLNIKGLRAFAVAMTTTMPHRHPLRVARPAETGEGPGGAEDALEDPPTPSRTPRKFPELTPLVSV